MEKVILAILRIAASPFVFGIIFTSFTFHAFKRTYLFLLHGGEWVNYTKDDKITMEKIYLKLKENDKL